MFESLLASLLDKYASEYLEGIDSKSANLSIWKGDVSLRNLKVKTSAFDELKLPVTVRYGYLEELTLKIPWKDLKTKPVNVILKGLYVVLAPVAQDCLVSSSPEDIKEALRKKARAAVDNLIKSEVAQKIPGFTERLLARIVDNIQIEFERLHISYIDSTVTSGSLSFGITIQGFTAKSADASGREAFVHESRILRKRVDLRCLSVYVNPVYDVMQKINLNPPFINTKAGQDAANSYLQLLIATSAQDASPLAKHILMPLSTTTVIEINKSDEPDANIPKYSVSLSVPKIELRLSNSQLNGLSEVAALLAQRSRIQFYRSYRVPFGLVIKEIDWFSREKAVRPTAAQRWRFACDATTAELHELNRVNRFSASRFRTIMQNVRRYRQLCCTPSKLLKPHEAEEMQLIDVLIPIDLLRIVRSRTVPELVARSAGVSDQVSTTSNSGVEKKKKGWLSGWFSKKESESPKAQGVGAGSEASFGLGLSASQELQLLETINTTDAELGAEGAVVHNAAEWVKMKLSLSVGELSIHLSESRSGNSGSTLGQLTLSTVNIVYRVRPAGWGLRADMRDMSLSDLISYSVGRTSFPYIIKRAPSVKDDEVVLFLHVESNPPDGSCAMSVSARAQPLTIVYHPEYIAALQAIFAVVPPSNLLSPVSDRLRTPPKSNTNATNMRRARAIVASATVLDVDLAAPIILVPQNGFLTSASTSALLVLTLGRFRLSTIPVSSLKREELANEPHAVETLCSAAELTCEGLANTPECFTCDSISPAISCVYDRMLLNITGLKSLMCSVTDKWWDANAVVSGGWEFILPINIDIAVLKLVCTSPLAVPLRVAIAIHNVQLNISRSNYMALFKIIDVFKAKGSQDNSQPNSQQTLVEASASNSNDTLQDGQLSPVSAAVASDEESSSVHEKVASMSVVVSSKKLALAMFCSDGSFNFSNCVPALALTDISIEGLFASYCSMPSGSSTVTATIGSFLISDVRLSRPVAPCFRQLLSLVQLHEKRPALSVIYDTNTQKKITTTNVSLHNIEILLISEPLALVAAIFVASKTEPTSDHRSKARATGNGNANSKQVKEAVNSVSSWTSEMNIFVINPNIALVSNPTDPASPRLNLNFSLMYHSDSSVANSCTRMCIQELNILRSVEGKAQADWDRLLEPASVTIEIAAAAILKNMTILMKSLAFKVSYADIRMLYTTYLTASHTFSDAMSVADPPVPITLLKAVSQTDEVDTSLPVHITIDSDSGSEGYDDAVQDLSDESNDDDTRLPSRQGASAVKQVFRVSVQLDKFYLSLLNTLGLWSNPILEVNLTDTMVDYLVGTDGHSSMGLSSCIMLTQWNPIGKTLEPLLESWTFRFESSQSFALMLIQSRDILNLNLSASQLKGTISTLKRIQADWADLSTANAMESDRQREQTSAPSREVSTDQLSKTSSKQLRTSPHTIVNSTGTRLHLWLQLPYRGEALSPSHFIIESDCEHCFDGSSLCPVFECFVAPEIDDQPLCPHPCRLTKAGVSTLVFGYGENACPCAIAHTELNSGATVTTVSIGYVVRNNTALELQIAPSDTDTFQTLLPGQSWYPPLALWKQYLASPQNSRSFRLRCGYKQKRSAAVTYGSFDYSAHSASEEGSSHQLQPRIVELPYDAHLVAKSEKYALFCGAEHLQRGSGTDCFVQTYQVLTCVSLSGRGSGEGQFVSCSIEPAFSFRNLTPVPVTAHVEGAVSSVSFELPPGSLFQMCSLIRGNSTVSVGLSFDGGRLLRNVDIDVLGSKVVHPIDIARLRSSSDKSTAKDTSMPSTRFVIERTDGSEHVIYAPYWIVNRSGLPISVCPDGKHHDAHVDASSLPRENMYSALPCDLSELLEKKGASVLMWGFSSAEDGKGGRFQLQVTGAKWCSQSFAADQLGEIGCLDLALFSSSKSSFISVAIYSHICPGAFWRSRTITLLPRHVLYNGTDGDIEVLCKTPEDARFIVQGVENRPYPSAVVPSKQWAILVGAPGKNPALRNFKIRPLRSGQSHFCFSPSFNAENLDGHRLRCRSNDDTPHDTINGHVYVDLSNPKIFHPSFNFKVDIKGSYGLLACVVSAVGWQVYRVSNRSPYYVMFHQQPVPISMADIVSPGSTCDFALDDTDQIGEIVEVVVLAGPNEKPLHIFKINFFNLDKSALKEMRYGDLKVTPSIQDGIYSLVVEPFVDRSADTVSRLRNIGSGLARTFRSSADLSPKGANRFLERANSMPQSPSVTKDSCNVAMFSAIEEDEAAPTSAPASDGGGEAASATQQAEEAVCDKRVDVKIAGIGISIIDDTPREILYVSILGIKYTRYASMGLDMHEVYLRRLQIDAESLIVLGHSIIPPDQMVQIDPSGILQIANNPIEPTLLTDADAASIWFARLIRRSDVTAMDIISEISVSIPSLDLSLQENSAMNVLKVVLDVASSFSSGATDGEGSFSENQLRSWLPLESPYIELEPLCAVSQNAQRVYVESLSINPVAVRISVHLDSKPLELKGVKGGLMALPLIIVNMLKSMAGNIDRAPISLNRLVFKNLLTSRERLVSRLTKHYTVQAAKESYKIVGSFELLGNPVGLISNVTEGLQEFVFAPIRGAQNSPKAFAVGLVKGTGALVKGSIYGAFSSVVSLSAAVGKGVAMLSFDDQFEQQRLESAARHQNDHLGAALAHGFTAVGRGVVSGVTELFMAPVRGAQEDGFTGLIKGIGKGVLGVVFKPAAGLIELASSTASGVRNMSNLLSAASGCYRIRPPRPFLNGVMQPYSLQWAYGVALLSAATDIRSHLGEQLFDFCQLSDRLLFVTNQRIVQVKTGANAAPGRWGSVQFELPLDSIIAVFTEGNKLLVELDTSVDGLAVGSCAKFFGKKQGSSMVRTFDLKTPERRQFSSILMSAIMSLRVAASSLDSESIWRPMFMGAVVGVEENQLRASVGGSGRPRPTHVKATVLGPQPWVSDDERRTCTLCDRKFHPFFRRHHCRMCGIIVCSKCSPSRVSLPDLGYQNLVRVCNPCFAHRNVTNPFDALDERFSDHASAAMSSASRLPVGVHGPHSVDFPFRAAASRDCDDVAGDEALDSPPSSPSVGSATPPPPRTALDVLAESQMRALNDSRRGGTGSGK